MEKILLNGRGLRIREIQFLANNPSITVEIEESALAAVEKCYEFLHQSLDKKIIYGVNTGFGPMASYLLGNDQLIPLQQNLVRSHAVGAGEPLASEYVLASMAVRLNTLVKGFSGVSPQLVGQLQAFINHRIIPIVPKHGAVGASGDLTHLAHIALALIGEGEVIYRGIRQPVPHVLEYLGLQPHTLRPKEGLALINGTSTMTGIAALLSIQAERLLSIAARTGALALEIVRGFSDCISEKFHSLRPHQGQMIVAKAMRTLLDDSRLLRDRGMFYPASNQAANGNVQEMGESVQQIYSLRCVPQILGPVYETLTQTIRVVETEINSVSDNPVVDSAEGKFLHGGHFHGDYIASALDYLKIALVKLTLLSERRINFFLNQNINKIFPPFLNLKTPGLTLGLQGLQFVATSTAARSQTLAFPHHLHSISTNADNQDVVSMGVDAALLTKEIVDNAYLVLAIELITLAQAVDFLKKKERLSQASQMLYELVRSQVAAIKDDRPLSSELSHLVESIKSASELDIRWGA